MRVEKRRTEINSRCDFPNCTGRQGDSGSDATMKRALQNQKPRVQNANLARAPVHPGNFSFCASGRESCGNDGRNYRGSDVILSEGAWMKARRVILRGPFPTVEETAKLLGVSDRRLKELLRLRSSGQLSGAKKNGVAVDMEKTGRKVSSTKNKPRTNRHTASASRKRRARGKTAKALS
jgi:hypothetical protein